MKRIIGGKKYDTETATKVASWTTSGYSRSDFRFAHEELYRKRTGEFFLYGEGNAMTQWASSCGNMRSWGSDIMPLTEEQAKLWVEEKANQEYETLFGEVAE
jgi:hypothetical protein